MRHNGPKMARFKLTMHLLVQLLIKHHANVVLFTRTCMVVLVTSRTDHHGLRNWTRAWCSSVRSFPRECHPSKVLYQLFIMTVCESATTCWHALGTNTVVLAVDRRSELRREINGWSVSNGLALVGNNRTNSLEKNLGVDRRMGEG
jgi:hypothetical protein